MNKYVVVKYQYMEFDFVSEDTISLAFILTMVTSICILEIRELIWLSRSSAIMDKITNISFVSNPMGGFPPGEPREGKIRERQTPNTQCS